MAALLPTTLWGKGEVTYTRLQSFYSNAGMVAIDKVVLSDTATVMYCTAKGKINSWFQFAPSTYLSDEEDARYPVKGAVGLTLGEKCYIPRAGQLEFRLLFEPMPEDTKIFDLIEGTDKDMVPHLWHPRCQGQDKDSGGQRRDRRGRDLRKDVPKRKGRGARQDRGIFTGLEWGYFVL